MIYIQPDSDLFWIVIKDNNNVTQLDVRLTKPQTRLLRDMLNSEELCD